jgi:hypothetical protein
MQDFWYKTEYLKFAFNSEVNSQFDQIIGETKAKTNLTEKLATETNPRL